MLIFKIYFKDYKESDYELNIFIGPELSLISGHWPVFSQNPQIIHFFDIK